MEFNLKRWKESVRGRLPRMKAGMRHLGVKSAYGYLALITLLPVAEALQEGQEGALSVLSRVAKGVEGEVLVRRLQGRVDEPAVQAEMANLLAAQAGESVEVRQALDAIFKKLNIMSEARALLPKAQSEWLRQELTTQYKAFLRGEGLIVQGAGAKGVKGGVLVERDVQGDVVIGKKEVIYTSAPLPDPVAQARRGYLQLLAQRCNVLPLAALGGREGVGEEVRLEEVYVALDTTARVPLTEEEKKQFRRDPRAEDRPLTALEVAIGQRRLVLLGDPGGGKSTFVRQLVAQVVRACEHGEPFAAGWESGLLPVLTVLRDLAPRLEALALHGSAEAQRKVLMAAIWAQWEDDLEALNASAFAPALREALLAGTVLLVFDGLDEVATAWRERVVLAVRALLHSYTKVQRIIVTCRIRSYEGAAVLHGFAQYTLAPFSKQQIRRFIAAWYQAQARLGRLDRATAQSRLDDLQRAALEPELRELAANPMLLTTMTLIHQQEVGLPRERVRLYARGVELLLSRWQKHKKAALSARLEALLKDERRLRLIMERLGYEAHDRQSQSEEVSDLPRHRLLGLLEQPTYLAELSLVGEFLDYVDQRAGLLVGCGGNEAGGKPLLYTFPHRTFQEYLAGCQMVRGRHREVIARYNVRLAEGDYWQLAALLGAEELFYERAGEKEVLDLAYALCPSRAPSSQAEWRGVLWSGLMAALVGKAEIERDAEQPGGDPAYLARLLTRLVQLLCGEHLPPIERAEAGRVLARLGDPRLHVMSVDEMQFCYVPLGPFWMGSPEKDQYADDNEKPLHQVPIPYDYWISRYPVTNAQFMEFVDDGGYQKVRFWQEAKAAEVWKDGWVTDWDSEPRDRPYGYGAPFNLPNHPVVGITWYEALAFTRWLAKRWGSEVRLPSEAEWEKAARGGLMIPVTPLIHPASTKGREGVLRQAQEPGARGRNGNGKGHDCSAFSVPQGLTMIENPLPQRRYPWGDDFNSTYTNSKESGIGHTNAVGGFLRDKSPYGCQEMSGNVWEWTASLYQSYPYQLHDNPENLSLPKNKNRVLRGGAFYDNSTKSVRCSFRDWGDPDDKFDVRGFRVFRLHKS